MRKIILLITAALALISCSCDKDVKTAQELAKRIMGSKAKAIVFEKLVINDKDFYEIESIDGKVHIRANNANSMAVGLNRYLQQFCLTNVSWYDYNKVELPDVLPMVNTKVSAEATVDKRFFLNYCTFGYTMPWWKWEQWERLIDWMALNGVNMPLAITGQEAVWQKVWKDFGLTDEQIRNFFTGPAHLPWQRMCNVDYWQGPLPQGWIDGQAKLQKKILKRERELNMTPVLPAFAGHIPAELAEVSEEKLDTFRVSYWGGFADKYRCTFLSPMDKTFAKIQKAYLEEQTRLYGTDHIYGIDPFNEVDAPFWDPQTLAKISSGIYESLSAVDPEAIWLQMGWLFYADQNHWTDQNMEAYLSAVPKGKMIILDYYCDYTQIWKRTKSFYGHDFIWCYLGNFGGMTGIEGDFHQNDQWLSETMQNAGPGFVGIGSTLEGFGVNEPVYEAVFAKAWDSGIGIEEYIDNIADRHLGRVDENYRAFWHHIADKVSVSHMKTGSSSTLNAHPSLEGTWHWSTSIARGYDIAELEKAQELLNKVEGDASYLAYDKANVARQVLCNRTEAARDKFTTAYKKGDRDAMIQAKSEFLSLCDQITEVLSTRKEFSLEDWINDARSWGKTKAEKDYYEMNARTIITVWSDSFHLWDYANRDWDGLVQTYYKPRWEMFFDAVIQAFDAGEPFENSKSAGYVGAKAAHGSETWVKGRALQLDRDVWRFCCDWAQIQYEEHSVKSPDGRITVTLSEKDGELYYSVSQDGEKLLVDSKLGFVLADGTVLGEKTKILSVEYSEAKETWETVWGQSRYVLDEHKAMTVHTDKLDIQFKVFNDGVGFRYIFPDELGALQIAEEFTEYKFARDDHKIWWMPRSEPYYEAYASHTTFDKIDCAYTPVSITGADGRFYSIHEAALLDFSKVNLVSGGKNRLKTSLTKWSDGMAVYVDKTRTSPWRTIIISDRAGGLIESNLMLNLNEPCKLEDTSWCKPGKYIGIWWELHKYLHTWYYGPEHGATTERTKAFIDFAASHNIQAVLVEGWNKGWEGDWMRNSTNFSFTEAYPDYNFDEVMKYAASKGVQMVIHNETAANLEHYFSQIDEAFALYQSYGMHYIKTGNVNLLVDGKEEHDSQYSVNRLHEIVRKAAQYQINVNEHEPCIPTGLCRTWPNLMSGEAIRGQEHDAWEVDGGNKPEHQTVCPFIRGLAGPMDYTFGTFDFSNPNTPTSRVRTTLAKQLAQYVVIYSPLQMASDLIEAYEGVKAFDFISDVPADWEQTKVIDSVIGDYIITARQERGGTDWYLGAITDEHSRDFKVSLDFLGSGKWIAQIYADTPQTSYEETPELYQYYEKTVSAKDVLDIHLATSGGCAVRFIKK